ncbi:MAG: hypothetical protein JSS07_08315 [Proteobacteria bacterium]|nr:hypothetical protein [Pseudomonadota bacterium]
MYLQPQIPLMVGYDDNLIFNYNVFLYSVNKYATEPITITPLKLSHLKKILTRTRAPNQLTDFSFSRFLVPYLCNYQGWAIFMDGTDMMLRDDIAKL